MPREWKQKVNQFLLQVTIQAATEHDLAGKNIKCRQNIFTLVTRLEATIIKRKKKKKKGISQSVSHVDIFLC